MAKRQRTASALLVWFVATVEWIPATGDTPPAAVHHPIITFETPIDGAVVQSQSEAHVPLRATIERLEEGSRVLIHLDGQRAEDITHVCTPPTCQVEVSTTTPPPPPPATPPATPPPLPLPPTYDAGDADDKRLGLARSCRFDSPSVGINTPKRGGVDLIPGCCRRGTRGGGRPCLAARLSDRTSPSRTLSGWR